ncbi:MAG: translation initiation factor IF-2, partial [Gammaproteobacteria bacterium]|nr:translation initiation factor IF-2 [Gammaproteobacteria bacterium]
MADVTVAQFAEVLKVPVERLIAQLAQAGIEVAGPNDRISDDAKLVLLTYLRRSHGQAEESGPAVAAPRKITLQRKQQSEIKLAGVAGRARTVNVEVRVKRTYVKRDVLEQQAKAQGEDSESKRRAAEEAARVERERQEHERREAERLEAENRRRLEEEAAARRAADEVRRAAEQRERDQGDADKGGRSKAPV